MSLSYHMPLTEGDYALGSPSSVSKSSLKSHKRRSSSNSASNSSNTSIPSSKPTPIISGSIRKGPKINRRRGSSVSFQDTAAINMEPIVVSPLCKGGDGGGLVSPASSSSTCKARLSFSSSPPITHENVDEGDYGDQCEGDLGSSLCDQTSVGTGEYSSSGFASDVSLIDDENEMDAGGEIKDGFGDESGRYLVRGGAVLPRYGGVSDMIFSTRIGPSCNSERALRAAFKSGKGDGVCREDVVVDEKNEHEENEDEVKYYKELARQKCERANDLYFQLNSKIKEVEEITVMYFTNLVLNFKMNRLQIASMDVLETQREMELLERRWFARESDKLVKRKAFDIAYIRQGVLVKIFNSCFSTTELFTECCLEGNIKASEWPKWLSCRLKSLIKARVDSASDSQRNQVINNYSELIRDI